MNEQGILSMKLLPAMIDMCKFRNIIVHDYTRIDPEIVIKNLTQKSKRLRFLQQRNRKAPVFIRQVKRLDRADSFF